MTVETAALPPLAARLRGVRSSPVRDILALTQQPGVISFAGGLPAPELFARVAEVTGREPLVFDGGPPEVRRLAIVSGGAASRLGAAVAEGYDAFLTGEPKENVMADAREAGIHFIGAGHYATETFGVRQLGYLLAAEFGIEHVWVDLPNPV